MIVRIVKISKIFVGPEMLRKRSSCTNDDFVSDYATSQAVEDYAEHFMHRFLDAIPRHTDTLATKTNHFADK